MIVKEVSLQEAIVNTVKEIFSSMIMMDIESSEIGGEDIIIETNLSSMLGLGGDVRGMLAIHMPETVAIKITETFLGMEVNSLDEDVKDAIGEVANMVAGGIKEYFTDCGIKTELAIPTTVAGNSYRTSGLAGAEKVVMQFECEPGVLWIEIKYILNKKNH